MKIQDYENYKDNDIRFNKSRLKDFIAIYADIVKKTGSENSIELTEVKENIKKSYADEVFLTLVDENENFVRFNVADGASEYVLSIFTDFEEYDEGSEKLSKLFLDKLYPKMLSPDDLKNLSKDDENFKGITINPHSQNFMMDNNGKF